MRDTVLGHKFGPVTRYGDVVDRVMKKEGDYRNKLYLLLRSFLL